MNTFVLLLIAALCGSVVAVGDAHSAARTGMQFMSQLFDGNCNDVSSMLADNFQLTLDHDAGGTGAITSVAVNKSSIPVFCERLTSGGPGSLASSMGPVLAASDGLGAQTSAQVANTGLFTMVVGYAGVRPGTKQICASTLAQTFVVELDADGLIQTLRMGYNLTLDSVNVKPCNWFGEALLQVGTKTTPTAAAVPVPVPVSVSVASMAAHTYPANVELLEAYWAAYGSGRCDAVATMLAPDFTWNGPVAGGKQQTYNRSAYVDLCVQTAMQGTPNSFLPGIIITPSASTIDARLFLSLGGFKSSGEVCVIITTQHITATVEGGRLSKIVSVLDAEALIKQEAARCG